MMIMPSLFKPISSLMTSPGITENRTGMRAPIMARMAFNRMNRFPSSSCVTSETIYAALSAVFLIDLIGETFFLSTISWHLPYFCAAQNILASTSLTLKPLSIIQLYSYRFRIECTFRELNQQVGAFCYHFWPKLSKVTITFFRLMICFMFMMQPLFTYRNRSSPKAILSTACSFWLKLNSWSVTPERVDENRVMDEKYRENSGSAPLCDSFPG